MQHTEYASGKWHSLSLLEQLANIGSEVGRAINWRQKGNYEYSRMAFDRSLELMHLTISTPGLKYPKLKEICRLKELWIDYYLYQNIYNSKNTDFEKYFLNLTIAFRNSHQTSEKI